MVRSLLAVLAGALLLGCRVAAAQGIGPVDLALVLAVDSSSSVNFYEFNLQMKGLAEAFRHRAVHDAIAAAAPNGVAITMVQWSGPDEQVQAFGWIEARGPETAETVARKIDLTPRLVAGGGTAIGSAIEFSAGLIRSSGIVAARRAIDVSGDGRNNMGGATNAATPRAVAAGITVNGLAILNEDPILAQYYRVDVIGGAGSFVIVADDYEDFADAIRVKLITEITSAPMS